MTLVNSWCKALAIVCFGWLVTSHSSAQDYPNKPVHIVVPFSAGGSTDQLARAIQNAMSESLGQPVIIDNKPGAGGAIGVEQVARAAPDGYTLVFGNTGPSAVVPLLRKVSYDPLKDFSPISTVALVPLALVGSTALPAQNFKEFLAYARNNDQLNYGSVGIGSMSHLTGEYFNQASGTRMLHIPFTGGSAMAVALFGREIETGWVNPLDGTAMVASGKVRYLAVATPRRMPQLPDVPAIAEFFPGFESNAWFGLLAPRGTPPAVIDKLNQAVADALRRPDVRRVLEDKMADPHPSSPKELEALIAREIEQWGDVIRKANVKF